MNADDRQALREKHRKVARTDMWYPIWICDYCSPPANPDGFAHGYPCDVIKVLDALDGGNPNFSDDLTLDEVIKPLLNVTTQPLIGPEVIKGSENLNPTNLKTEVECDHSNIIEFCKCDGYSDCVCGVHEYCPKCGEKL